MLPVTADAATATSPSLIYWHDTPIAKRQRAMIKGQQPCVLWFSGLSGSGKSTIAGLVETKLHRMGRHTYALDGDNLRFGLNQGLGFSDADRNENIRRAGEVARLMVDAGLIVLASFISPFQKEREMVRNLFDRYEFIEIFVDVPLAVAMQRDPKGLYSKALRGELKNFTGIDSRYEPPINPELRIDAAALTAEAAAEGVIDTLRTLTGLRVPGSDARRQHG
jgi:bifunctional enzyme CysN/CysC